MHVRVCPECGEEYRPEIVRCADCGATLEDRHLDDDAPLETPGVGPPIEAKDLPPGIHRSIYSSERAEGLIPFSDRLAAAGIPFGVRGSFQTFELLVREEDLERALAEVSPLLGTEIAALEACPACQTPLPADADACPECGLAL
jgi:hypothetical protein